MFLAIRIPAGGCAAYSSEMGVPIGNVLLYVIVIFTPMAVFELVRWWLMNPDALTRRRRPPSPDGLPIERLAADLRRVHRSLRRLAPDAPELRRRATRQAYDALLADACRALDVPHRLDETPDGLDREIERLRVEEALRTAGLAIP